MVKIVIPKVKTAGNSPGGQWLALSVFTAIGMGSIPG